MQAVFILGCLQFKLHASCSNTVGHKPQPQSLLLPTGHVTGLDQAADVLELARTTSATLGQQSNAITLLLPPRHVTGVDQAADVLELARTTSATLGQKP